jgi:hypothetical protein
MSDGQFKILVVSPEASISGTAYISALEQSHLFADLKMITQLDPKQMQFSMALRTQQALNAEPPGDLPEAAESPEAKPQPVAAPQAAKASR